MNEIEKFIEKQKNLNSPDYTRGGKFYPDFKSMNIKKEGKMLAVVISVFFLFVILLFIFN